MDSQSTPPPTDHRGRPDPSLHHSLRRSENPRYTTQPKGAGRDPLFQLLQQLVMGMNSRRRAVNAQHAGTRRSLFPTGFL